MQLKSVFLSIRQIVNLFPATESQIARIHFERDWNIISFCIIDSKDVDFCNWNFRNAKGFGNEENKLYCRWVQKHKRQYKTLFRREFLGWQPSYSWKEFSNIQ